MSGSTHHSRDEYIIDYLYHSHVLENTLLVYTYYWPIQILERTIIIIVEWQYAVKGVSVTLRLREICLKNFFFQDATTFIKQIRMSN